MSRPVGLGIAGCGVIGTQHLRTVSGLDCAQVHAVLDLDGARARRAADAWHVPRVCASLGEMLTLTEVEAVLLAFPPAGRLSLARQVMDAGRHLLLEKPAAKGAAEIRLLQAWRPKGIVAATCASRFRLTATYPEVRRLLDGDPVGRWRHIHFRSLVPAGPRPVTPPPAWRLSKGLNGGGILMNWGVYDFDFVLNLGPEPLRPRQARAAMWGIGSNLQDTVHPDSDAETHVAAWIDCADGVTIQYERGEYLPGPARSDLVLTGEHGRLDLQMVPRPETEDRLYKTVPAEGRRLAWSRRLPEPMPDLHTGVLEDFCRAVREGVPPASDLNSALRVQAVIDACYRSAESGSPATISC